MPILNRIAAFQDEMTAWRRDIHAHPEIAFEEHRTSDLVAAKLAAWGIEVHRGLAGTGVVGVLKGAKGDSARAIALRADMDALLIAEEGLHAHASRNPGKMHACGHDGHTTMLLGAARHLAETRNFAGTLVFIFQPAEENEAGARRMVQEGLFDQFPVDQVWGMHNWPNLPLGTIGVLPGPVMASADIFDVRITGKGGHAAFPHATVDPIVAAAHIVTALQTIVSREIDPVDRAVVSVTSIEAGHTYNVIPEQVHIRGTARAFRPETRDRLEAGIRRIVSHVAEALGATAETVYNRKYPATINTLEETAFAGGVAAEIVGEGNVRRDLAPSMGAEDFSYMLQQRPGSYIWLGTAMPDGTGAIGLHNPKYDFNDAALPIGASYWVRLAESALAA